jgi:hypothetical protein
MRLLLKYILYTLLIVVLVSGTILLYRAHPEAQLAFIIPGLLILAFSRMSDDLNFKAFLPKWTKEK